TFQVEIEFPLRREVERPLHHAVGFIRGNNACLLMCKLQLGQIREMAIRSQGSGARKQRRASGAYAGDFQESSPVMPPNVTSVVVHGGCFPFLCLFTRHLSLVTALAVYHGGLRRRPCSRAETKRQFLTSSS